MKVALVALPWASVGSPSGALGALKAFLRRDGIEAHAFYEYVDVAVTIGIHIYSQFADSAYQHGEMLYGAMLYPENRQRIVDCLTEWLLQAKKYDSKSLDFFHRDDPISVFIQGLINTLANHLEECAHRYASFDVIGMTTVFGQMFANIALAKMIKTRSPRAKIVLGGSTVSRAVGPSLMAQFPFVDYIIQGEGELPFTRLIKCLSNQTERESMIPGVITRENFGLYQNGGALSEVPDMRALPMPDYDEYVAVADKQAIAWCLPIEGSRGCWWDRTSRTKNPKQTCYFCNLNVQWNGYREKSVEQIVREIESLTDRYSNTSVFFLDNIIRAKGIVELSDGLKSLGRPLSLFYEARASISPFDLLLMKEAGLNAIQVGIEGLSTSYLRRIGKGTTLLQNLQTLTVCKELEIAHFGNLIINFPGATETEVRETVEVIRRYAYSFDPLIPVPFSLGIGSTAHTLLKEFGLSNVRNESFYDVSLPEEVRSKLQLFDLTYERTNEVDWDPVMQACAQWQVLHRGFRTHPHAQHFLSYDEIDDARIRISERSPVRNFSLVLRRQGRELFEYTSEIRTWQQTFERFRGRISPGVIEELIQAWSSLNLLAYDGGKFVNVVPAARYKTAARRIRRLRDRNDSGCFNATHRNSQTGASLISVI